MVNILPEAPGFGAKFARGLGAGISHGVSQASDFANKIMLKNYETQKRQKLIESIEGNKTQATNSPEDISKKFIEALPDIEQHLGRELAPKEVDQLWNTFSQSMQQGQSPQGQQGQEEDPFLKAKKYAAAGEHDLSRVSSEEARMGQKQSFAREQSGEKELSELDKTLQSTKRSSMRFERLNELFKPEKESQFPPSLAVGMFTKNGELTPVGQSLLSSDAQEAVKLVTDELEGAKNTFGSRVTNFDAQLYLKKLPSLLNTPDGRRRVLRDLRIMNKLNELHSNGILDVVDRYGGPGKISVSKAKRVFEKEFEKREDLYRKEFVKPGSSPINELNADTAFLHEGKTVEDEETGQEFTSDGRQWHMKEKEKNGVQSKGNS